MPSPCLLSHVFRVAHTGREQKCPRHTGAGQASGRERSPAATRLGGLGIHKDEALLHQRFLIVQDHTVQVDERLRVHKDTHVAELENAVAFAWLSVEADVVTQA